MLSCTHVPARSAFSQESAASVQERSRPMYGMYQNNITSFYGRGEKWEKVGNWTKGENWRKGRRSRRWVGVHRPRGSY
eukprot:940156-Prorocentrum_minimum.AAC.1